MSGPIPPRPDLPHDWAASASVEEAAITSRYGSPPVGIQKTATALCLLALGLAADLATSHLPGIGIPLVAIAGSLLLIAVARAKREGLALLALATVFTLPVAVRADPYLTVLNVGAALVVAVLAASYAQGGSPLTDGIRGWIGRSVGVLRATMPGLSFFSPGRVSLRSEAAGRVARTLLIAGSVFVAFAVVLASADAVFSRIVTTPFRWNLGWSDLVQHTLRVTFLAAAAAILVAYATGTHTARKAAPIETGLSLIGWEWATILGSVCALFALFVAIQFEYMFGGQSRVMSVPGLSYAEYARSGFGQMVFAAAMSLGLIAFAWVTWPRERRSDRVTFASLAALLLSLNLLVLASAFKRLTLYEGAYGWTLTRIFAHTIILWMSGFIVCTLIAVVVAKGRWVLPAGVGLGLAALMALNVVNVGAFISDRNLERYRTTGKLDVAYLSSLSEDAVPVLVQALPSLPPDLRAGLTRGLQCNLRDAAGQPATSWNLGRERALSSLAAAGIPAAGPGDPCYSLTSSD